MGTPTKRIAMNMGSGFVPGLNAVVMGAVLAAGKLGIEIVGIHDGYDGIFFPDRYPEGGVVTLTPRMVEALSMLEGSFLGTGARTDPFRARTITPDNFVEETDRSDELLGLLKKQKIDAVISIVGASSITGLHALTVAMKLQRKGLRTICIPKSAENDVAATQLAFGYNSVLSHTTEMLRRIQTGVHDVRRIAVVEVFGQHAGWLALQAGMAVGADVVLIPEIPYDLNHVAATLKKRHQAGKKWALVVAAEGAMPVPEKEAVPAAGSPKGAGLRESLAPNSEPTLGEGARIINRSGSVSESVAFTLQRLTDFETFPLVLGQLVRTGPASAVDLQLGMGYGAAALGALLDGKDGVMMAFQPPEICYVPLSDALNKVRTVPVDSFFVKTARSLGICLGDSDE